MGLTLIIMSKRGALKSKYSCAVHSDFYCFALADICQHGLLQVATCVAYTIYSLTDVQQWSLNAPLILRHFSTSGNLWCVHTSIIVHWPTSFNIARCRPSSLSDATATRLGIAGHLSTSSVDRCTAMKSERTIMVRSDFITVHRSTLDVDRCPAMPSLVAVASLIVHRKFRLSLVKPSYLGLA